MIGKTILHYKILEQVGEGGMGVVYKAEDTKLKRDVAIKFLPRQISANGEERERFKIEAQAAAALNHPNIATIYAIEEANDEMFIVMENIEGQELKNIVGAYHDTPIPIKDIINYATQIAEGLQAAHEKGIIHRDIKSSNIMITPKGQVKIMDFGLVQQLICHRSKRKVKLWIIEQTSGHSELCSMKCSPGDYLLRETMNSRSYILF
jgi:serine/threonine protein kinase